jgi:hypothetical protein
MQKETLEFGSARDIAEALQISKDYLLNVRSGTGHASWMAGDMLSDHRHTEESLPVLLLVAQKARFLSGRITALNSLGFLMKDELPIEDTAAIGRVLRAIGRKERNPGIKSEAKRLLMATGI